jgi:hypothetical protein
MIFAQMVTDLQLMDCSVLRTETRPTMKGITMWPLAGMLMMKEVPDFQEAMSTLMIIQIMTELKKRSAVLWRTCMIYRGITPRSINIVAAQEMLHIVTLIGIWSKYHAGNMRSLIMEAVTGATSREVMVMATNTAEVQLRIIAKSTMEQMSVTVMRRHTTSIYQLNWKSGFRDMVGTLEVKPTIQLLQWGGQKPYL